MFLEARIKRQLDHISLLLQKLFLCTNVSWKPKLVCFLFALLFLLLWLMQLMVRSISGLTLDSIKDFYWNEASSEDLTHWNQPRRWLETWFYSLERLSLTKKFNSIQIPRKEFPGTFIYYGLCDVIEILPRKSWNFCYIVKWPQKQH